MLHRVSKEFTVTSEPGFVDRDSHLTSEDLDSFGFAHFLDVLV